ncbi:MAG: hypothetical protein KGL39_38485 [Patescibacteria group bacterium]|nr:hypothetical protein [Patescibacteria group bacterium]
MKLRIIHIYNVDSSGWDVQLSDGRKIHIPHTGAWTPQIGHEVPDELCGTALKTEAPESSPETGDEPLPTDPAAAD